MTPRTPTPDRDHRAADARSGRTNRHCRTTSPTPPPTATRGFLIAAVSATVAVGFAAAAVALAEPAWAEQTVLAQARSVKEVLDNVRSWLMGILALLATVFLTIGGVRYVMAGGDPGEVEKSKTAFKAAGIGYALAALAPVVVAVLQGIVGF